MSQGVEQKLLELYLSNTDLVGEGFPASFNRGRQPFVESLRLGSLLPGEKDERYHLAGISSLYSGDWEYYFTPPAWDFCEGKICGGSFGQGHSCRVALDNGFSKGEITQEENGVVTGSLRTAAKLEEIVREYYNRAITKDGDAEPLAALNAVFMQDGAFVHVPEGIKADKPIIIDCRYFSPKEDVACMVRMLLVFGKGSSAEVVIIHHGGQGAGFLANSVCEAFVGEGADVRISLFSCMNNRSTLLHGNFVRQQAKAKVDAVCVSLGSNLTRVAHLVGLEGPHAETGLHGLYVASGDRRMAFDVQVDHLVPDCRSFELVKGIASGQAAGSFTGRVYVARDAQRTEALQQSRNIELGDGAKIFARPQLEIYADDVKCSHGATVGQLDSEAVYYMRQRGIDLRTARRLQLEGFVRDITSHYGNGREFFDSMVADTIDSL